MDTLNTRERAAERLLREKDSLAAEITAALYERMPHLLDKYGEHGRGKCLEDMRYNIEHLAPAVHLGVPEMFVTYVRWLDELLRARNVSTDDLSVALELTGGAMRRRFSAAEAAEIELSLRPALALLREEITA